jgi:16S rRNA processing protein RimM
VTLPPASPTEPPSPLVHVADAVNSHGLDGTVKVKTADPYPDWLSAPVTLWVTPPNASVAAGPKVCRKATLIKPGVALLSIEGVTTPQAAQALVGARFALPAASLPAPNDADTYRSFQLEGLSVLAADTHEVLGSVNAVTHAIGNSQAFLEVCLVPHNVLRLVPFNQHFVSEVNLEAGHVMVEGLTEFLKAEALQLPTPKAPKRPTRQRRTPKSPAAAPEAPVVPTASPEL